VNRKADCFYKTNRFESIPITNRFDRFESRIGMFYRKLASIWNKYNMSQKYVPLLFLW